MSHKECCCSQGLSWGTQSQCFNCTGQSDVSKEYGQNRPFWPAYWYEKFFIEAIVMYVADFENNLIFPKLSEVLKKFVKNDF